MIKAETQTIWTKFRELINSQIHQVELCCETSEKLQRLREVLEKTNGHKSRVEFRLISFCTVRILQLCNYLWTKGETEMGSTEEKEEIKREIRDSLLNLELRLGKYTDEVIYRHFNENDKKFRKEEAYLLDNIECTFRNKEKSEVNVESSKDSLLDIVHVVCARARDIGYNVGELTLSNDMAEILNTIKLLSKSFAGENTKNNIESSNSTNYKCRTVSPFERHMPSSSEDIKEVVDVNSVYTGSELSADWATARNTALRTNQNIPKLDFQFLDSDHELEGADRKYEASCWSSRTSSCVEEEICEQNSSHVFKAKSEKTEVSSVYKSLSSRSIPSDVGSHSTETSSYRTECRSSTRSEAHSNCFQSFTVITRNLDRAMSDRLETNTTPYLSRRLDLQYLASYHRSNSIVSSRSTYYTTARYLVPSDLSYRNSLSLAIVIFCLLLLRMTWVYVFSECPTRHVLRNSFYPEMDKISFLLDFLYNNMEIKYQGLPPV